MPHANDGQSVARAGIVATAASQPNHKTYAGRPYPLPSPTKIFVLTGRGQSEQKTAARRVRDEAMRRCGVEVDVSSSWLSGPAALDEFLGNSHRVLRHVMRHRLFVSMW